MLFDQAHEVSQTLRVDVAVTPQAVGLSHDFLRRSEAQGARRRRINGEEFPFRRGLVNSFHCVFEDGAVFLLRRFEGLLCEFALRDVASGYEFRAAPTVIEDVRGDLHIDYGAVLLPMPPDTGVVDYSFRDTGDIREQQWLVIGRANVDDRHGEEFLAPIAVMGDGGVIDFEKGKGLKIINPHGQRIRLEEAAVTFLALFQRLSALLALGDVLDASFVIERTPLGVADDSRILSYPDPGAVFATDFVLETGYDAVFLQHLFKFIAQSRLGITLALDIIARAD